MFSQDRSQMRKAYIEAWRKFQQKLPMEPLEEIIANVISQHPEYHAIINEDEKNLERDYLPETGDTNPFLHMGMHIAIHEQLVTDRPNGISSAFQQLVMNSGDAHAAEHIVMECLGEMLWRAQRENKMPDEKAYLDCIRNQLS